MGTTNTSPRLKPGAGKKEVPRFKPADPKQKDVDPRLKPGHAQDAQGATRPPNEGGETNFNDIIKMIRNSALPDSFLVMTEEGPLRDHTAINHRIGCTLSEIEVTTAADMFAMRTLKGKHPPNKMVFTCTWGGLKLRCLIDCGSTLEAIFNTGNNAVPFNKVKSAIKSRHRLKTGGGTVTSDTQTWGNQGLVVQDTRVSVSQLTAVQLPDLPYDLILGYPFLSKYNAKADWTKGTLQFRRFRWEREETVQTGYVNPESGDLYQISHTELLAALKAPEKLKETDRIDAFVLLSLKDVSDFKVGLDKAPEHLKRIKEHLLVDKVDYEKQDSVLNRELTEEQQGQLVDLTKKYSSIFTNKDNLPAFAEIVKHREPHEFYEIPTGKPGARPPQAKPRRHSPVEAAEMKRILTWLLTHDFIEKTPITDSAWASPLLCVKKADGSLRMCCDYRQLNAMGENQHPRSPLPLIKDLMAKLKNSKYHSALDLVQGYAQTILHPNSRHKSSIICSHGLFSWKVVPFGLAGAPSFFQNCMNRMMDPLSEWGEFTAIMLDDILVFSETFEEHLEHLERVFNKLKIKKYWCNLSKCALAFPRVKYLGQIVGGGERKPNPDKVKHLVNMANPTTTTELRGFLGLGAYLSDYIPNFAKICAPFTPLRGLPKRTKITLNKEQNCAMKQLKTALTNAPVLKLCDPDKVYYVMPDASRYAIGAALLQEYGGRLMPLEYRSVTLDKPARKWAIHDKELYAIIDATQHWRQYLQDKKFFVLSDHLPLKHFKTQPKLSARQIRYLDHMAMFEWQFIFVQGKDNVFGDPMSRPPSPLSLPNADLENEFAWGDCTKSPCSLCKIAESEPSLARFDKEINLAPPKKVYFHTCGKDGVRPEEAAVAAVYAATECLANLTQITGLKDVPMEDIKKGYSEWDWSIKVIKILKDTSNRHHYHTKYVYSDGILFLLPNEYEGNSRICVPNGTSVNVRKEIMNLFHNLPVSGHRDAEVTYLNIRSKFYWPNMYKHVKKYVATCDTCLKNKALTRKMSGLLQPIPYPSTQPFAELTTDFATCLPDSLCQYSGVSFNAIQIYVCRLSRRAKLLKCRTTDTAAQTAHNFLINMFTEHGVPKSLISDRDPKFVNKFFDALSGALNVRLKRTASHNPRADGQSEALVKIITNLCRIFVSYLQDDWVDYLPMLEFCLNNHVVRSRGSQTPFLISLGYNPHSPLDFITPKYTGMVSGEAKDYLQKQMVAAALAQDAIISSQDTIAAAYNKKRVPHSYAVGDKCYLRSQHVYPPGEREKPSEKMRKKFMGPFRITDLIGNNAVRVSLPRDMHNHPVFSVDSTKPCPEGARLPVAQAVPEEGDRMLIPKGILNYKESHKNKTEPHWLVDWGGYDPNHPDEPTATWEPYDSFVDKSTEIPRINVHLVEYELARTGLKETTNSVWAYKPQPPGTVSKEADGFEVYHAQSRDTLHKAAEHLSVPLVDLFEQNAMRYGDLYYNRGKKKVWKNFALQKKTQLRLPLHMKTSGHMVAAFSVRRTGTHE